MGAGNRDYFFFFFSSFHMSFVIQPQTPHDDMIREEKKSTSVPVRGNAGVKARKKASGEDGDGDGAPRPLLYSGCMYEVLPTPPPPCLERWKG